MGRWKYVNWLIVAFVLAHMYYYLAKRYEAHAMVYVLATVGWVTTAILGYYIYVYRINRLDRHHRNTIAEPPSPKPPFKERPKVTFKKKDQH